MAIPTEIRDTDTIPHLPPTDLEEVHNFASIPDFLRQFTDFNQRLTIGESIARAVVARFMGPDDEDPYSAPNQADILFFISQHKDLLDFMGLSVNPVGERFAQVYKQGQEIPITSVQFGLTSADKFVTFLTSLKSVDLQQHDLERFLAAVLESLIHQLAYNYDLNKKILNDDELQLVANMGKIMAAYKQLNIVRPEIEQFAALAEHIKDRDLTEFLELTKSLLRDQDHFGPGAWHRESSQESYAHRWQKALSELQKLKENPRTQKLYNTVLAHLKKCVVLALEDEDVWRSLHEQNADNQAALLSILKYYSDTLNDFQEIELGEKAS
jgi:hypothetical protein